MDIDHSLLTQPAATNPYRYALRVLRLRLAWDFTWESFRSRRILSSWKNRFPGAKAVVVCNGPSLLKADLSLLSGVFSFGLNKINLLYERSDFRPSAIVAVNPLVIEQNAKFYNETELPLFLDCTGRKLVRSRRNVAFLNSTPAARFSRDCSMSFNYGATVTNVALQLAFHMGFRDVAVVGCDHNFATKGVRNQTVVSEAQDESHFDPRYFAGGQKWQLPDLVASEYYYSLAADAFAAFGGRVVNCTEGGQLELLQRMSLGAWRDSRLG